MSDAHTLTDAQLVQLYLSGYYSGAVTMLRAVTDTDADECHDAARHVVRRMADDPAVRESILDLWRAGGGGIELPVPPSSEGSAP